MIMREDRTRWCAEDEDALWRSCFHCYRSSMLEQSPACYSLGRLSGLF